MKGPSLVLALVYAGNNSNDPIGTPVALLLLATLLMAVTARIWRRG